MTKENGRETMTDCSIELSVIIPSYNPDPGDLMKCLKSIRASTFKPAEVILLDDGSGADYPQEARELCVLIKNKENRGPAHVRNQGARLARGDVLCFIDADVMVGPDTLLQIAEKFRDSNIAAVQTIFSIDTPAENFASQY